jgi:hypothetical protein
VNGKASSTNRLLKTQNVFVFDVSPLRRPA